jgi:hypothetical protein
MPMKTDLELLARTRVESLEPLLRALPQLVLYSAMLDRAAVLPGVDRDTAELASSQCMLAAEEARQCINEFVRAEGLRRRG